MRVNPAVRFPLFRCVVLLNIVMQCIMPVLLSFSWVFSAHAASSEQQFSESMSLMSHSAILSNSTPAPAPPAGATPEHTAQTAASPLFSAIPSPSAVRDTSPAGAATSRSLPSLTTGREDNTPPEKASDEAVMDSGRGAATRLWQILGSDDPAGQGRSAAAGIATGIASQRMEAWLNQYGHARVNLSFPGGGDLDLLVPVLDTPDLLLFTQGGIRRDTGDKRTTTNLGLGLRGFTDSWMLGVNSFYDYDMTGENSRYGIGTEAWTDYLKLSANLYQRITDWHQSDIVDMEDYDERPANGYDVRLAGWLPAYPTLGMNLVYEKYYGKNVALDDHTDLKDSPSAVTAGLNYTPIPLLTLGAEHRSGSGTNDSRVFLNINYRPGVSMADQTDPDMVGMIRTLAGSRYDMVERNNTIVMQYKKQELITLSLPATLAADAGSSVLLTADVRAKYGLDSVDWDYSSITSAGGRVTQPSRETLQITLPPWQATKGSTNSYTISAVARDTHGNLSNSAQTQLAVNKSRNDISSFVVVNDNAPANGSDRDSVRLTVVDTQTSQPVPGLTVTFSAKTGKLLPQKATTDAKGMATADITSVVAGTTDVTATLENGNAAAVAVTFVADATTAGISDLAVTKDNAAADGKAANAVQATVKDAQGNTVQGVPVAFSAGSGAVVKSASVVTDAKGQASTTLTNLATGTTVVTAVANNASRSVNTTFTADAATAVVSSLGIDNDGSPADGKTANSATATVVDANGNPVAGQTVTWSADKGTVKFAAGGVTDTAGKATVTFTDTVAETANITASLNGSSQTKPSSFIADVTTATVSTLTVDKEGSPADGKTANSATATVVDANGNPVAGQTVTWSADKGTVKFAAGGVTDTAGKATVTFTDTVAETANITASLGSSSQTKPSSFMADASTAVVSTLSIDKDGSLADGKTANSATATVVDVNGNPIAGQTVTWSADKGTVKFAAGGVTDTAGKATVTFTDTVAETANITASLGSSSQTKPSSFMADASTATVSTLTVDKDGSVADGKTANSATATVVDANGNPVAGQTVTWSADKGTVKFAAGGVTDTAGKATVTFTDTVAETANITASLNGSSQTKPSSFMADASTATVSTLSIDKDGSLADGKTANSATATVVDANGNPVAGQTVTWSADKGTVKFAAGGVTDTAGKATVTFTDTVAETANITASLNGSSQTKPSSFIADVTTATVSTLTIDKDGSLADGKTANSATATVVDANGNPVAGQTVTWSADKGTVKFAAGGVTDTAGKATVTFTDTVAETANITASLGSSSQTKPSSFIADVTTATVSTLTIDKDGSPADGKTANSATATVVDVNGNPIAGQTVTWSADKGTVVFAASGVTDAGGKVSVTFTDTVAETANITATLGSSSQTKPSVFVADAATAVVSTLTIDKDGSPADGKTANSATATVLDAKGNPVAGQTVTWSADKGTVVFAASGVTDAGGKVSVTFTDTVAETANITATLGSSSQTKPSVFVADAATAVVSTLTIDKDGSPADGKTANSATATVLDAKGNPVAGQTVTWSADKGTVVFAASGVTDAGGKVSVTFTDTVAETANITATLGSSSQTKPSVFVADAATAVVSTLTIDKDGSPADGKTANSATATVLDAKGNPVAGQTVTWSADKGTVVFAASGVTDAGGKVSVTFTDTVAETANITATLGSSSQTKPSVFVADAATAVVSTLTIDKDGSPADGKTANSATATVLDAKGNPVAGQTVTWSADKGTVVFAASGVTDAGGKVSVTFTDTVAETANITATLDSSSQTKPSVFVADAATAVVSTLTIDKDGSPADGKTANSATATVLDAKGNPVAGQTVTWSADKGTVVFGTSGTTGADGKVSVDFTDTAVETVNVTVTLASNGSNKNAAASFITDPAGIVITEITLGVDRSLANGTEANQVTAKVVDAAGNVLNNQTVHWQASAPGVTIPATSTTDINGISTVSLTSTVPGTFTLTANLDNGNTKTVDTVFLITAQILAENIKITTDNAASDGIATNAIQVLVVDGRNAPVAGQTVSFTATNSAVIQVVQATTGADGLAKATATNIHSGTSTVTASLTNGSSAEADMHFAIFYASFESVTPGDDDGGAYNVTSGFPSTGFTGAAFTLEPGGGKNRADYTWSSSASWVSINNGHATFTGQGTSETVTITATPISVGGPSYRYQFALTSWFVKTPTGNIDAVTASCNTMGLPLVRSSDVSTGTGQRKARGPLWDEWGYFNTYGIGATNAIYTQDRDATNKVVYLNMTTGHFQSTSGSSLDTAFCVTHF
ncbi:Ig-like domain-containing protein [Citrobacter portucalensis]|uniref:Ig-like domain-containing protein n=1 Tax=Citrobacter portucalensis TaxID=1639133 RepID=UPI002889724D|nr:Ig-like domain-containing protein [Citrobacter portucalensis]WNI84131.1 Ig-like domain-containing protein [Citrobacter portucalensis]